MLPLLFGILAIVAGLATFVFFIIVLIKLFQDKGPLHGILGIFCGLYTYIWGWMNADRLGLRKTMLYWTIATVVLVVFQVIVGLGAIGTANPALTPGAPVIQQP